MELLPDCVLRSMSVALNHSYIDLCKMFGVKYRLGKGMIGKEGVATPEETIKVCSDQGFIGAHDIDEIFNRVYDRDDLDVYMDTSDNRYYDDKDSLIDVENGLSLREFAAMLPGGRYLLFLRPTTKSRLIGDNEWHQTYYNKDEDCLYDTFNCTKGTVVFGFAQVKPEAVLSDEDPLSRTKELEKVKAGQLWGNVIPPEVSPELWKEKIRTKTLNPRFLEALWKHRLREMDIIK